MEDDETAIIFCQPKLRRAQEEGRLIECEMFYPELFIMLEIMNFLGLDCRAAIKPINSIGPDLRAAVVEQTHSLT